jgi:hypothetical protein
MMPQPHPRQKRDPKAQLYWFRSYYNDPFVLDAKVDVGQHAAAILCMASQVTAAQGEAAYVQRHLLGLDASYIDT